jgi:predicted cobalt transporter CbtA
LAADASLWTKRVLGSPASDLVGVGRADDGGPGLIFSRRSVPASIAGLILIVLPRLIGAPEPDHVETNVPTSLSHQFVVAVTLTSLVFWFMLGGLTSVAFAHLDRDTPEAAPA